ncbi:MAG: hypothetical protein HY556_01685 [Euryarchaeota archaeon]|nr:hypothetical protein [Euryarchaeota archaeon]
MSKDRNLVRALGDVEFVKFLFFDVFFALIVGLIAWFVSKDSVTSLLLSLLVSLVLLTIELRFQLTLTGQNLTKALGFEHGALQDGFLVKSVPELVDSYSALVGTHDGFFIERAQRVVSECNSDVKNLRDGYFKVGPEEFNSVVSTMLAHTKTSMFGTVFVKLADYWNEGSGRAYLEENFKATKRGVKITRVFFLEDPTHLNAEVRDLMVAQARGGIDVRIAMTQKLPPDLMRDIGIFDEDYVWWSELVPGAMGLQQAGIYRDEREVRRALGLRDRLLRETEPALAVLERLDGKAST